MYRGGAVGIVGCLMLASSLVVAEESEPQPPLIDLEGLLEPRDGHLRGDGILSVVAPTQFSFDFKAIEGQNSSVFLRADRGRVTIQEWHRTEAEAQLDEKDSSGGRNWPLPRPADHTESFQVHDFNITNMGPSNSLAFSAYTHNWTRNVAWNLTAQSHCVFRPDFQEVFPFNSQNTVYAECWANQTQVIDRYAKYEFSSNMDLLLQCPADADCGLGWTRFPERLVEADEREPYSKLLQTGYSVEENPQDFGREEQHVYRVVKFINQWSSNHRDAQFEWNGEARFVIQSEGLLFAGELKAPGSQGTLHWGSTRQDGDIAPMVARGVFSLDPDENRNALQVSGRTIEGPPSPEPPSETSMAPQVVSMALVAAVAGSLFNARLRYIFIGLFTRIRRGEVAMHPHRSLILDALAAEPGLSFKEIQEATGLSRRSVTYHVRYMEQHGVVRVRQSGGRTSCFAQGQPVDVPREWIPLLRRDGVSEMIVALDRCAFSSQRELARHVGMSRSWIGKRLQAMAAHGIVSYPDAESGVYRPRREAVRWALEEVADEPSSEFVVDWSNSESVPTARD